MGRFVSPERFDNTDSKTNESGEKSNIKQTELKRMEAPNSQTEYLEGIEAALRNKEYNHWNSKEEQEFNRKLIYDYDDKKRNVDKASLQTQRYILTKYDGCFDEKHIARMASELGSNKIEIYNEPYFKTRIAADDGTYKVLGVRTFPEGKICIRDSNDIARMQHTSTHETMHDLSYQHSSEVYPDEGSNALISHKYLTSGIHKVETKGRIIDGQFHQEGTKHYNRGLNEGFTELYTVEAMQERSDNPDFDSYSQEVGWAQNLREIAGDDKVAKAYFGGDVDGLKQYVDEMSDTPEAWVRLNYNIDAYHETGYLYYKNEADAIIDSLQK